MQDGSLGQAPQFRILGPVEMGDGGEAVRLRSRSQRLLLTILLLEANRAVAADRLVDELWTEQLPEDPGGALRTQVSRLRRVLPAGARLVTEPRGYRLAVEDDDVDVRRFEKLLTRASNRTGRDALHLIDAALGLWRGDPFDEFIDRSFARAEQRRLGELHVAAQERRLGLLLEVGRTAEAAAAAHVLLARRPDREQTRAALMEALYWLGGATEALDIYESWRHELGERGLEPSRSLRDLEARILRHAVTEASEVVAVGGRELVRVAGVPRPVSRFIGRDSELHAVIGVLARARLVTLWGPGGVGKTRLAVEVAASVFDSYRNGVHICDLGALSAGSDVVHAIAREVGVQEHGGRSLDGQLVEGLSGRRVLLVLDNCEHVLGAVATIAEHLVQSNSGVDVLATSRERLGVDGECLWEVRPLDASGPDSPAVDLFVDRALATNQAFRPTPDDRHVIAELCRRLDGLPLALELGAARTRGFSLRGLRRALDGRIDVLQGGAGRPHRHRSLRAVIDWSYSLLTLAEQRTFERLAVFRGPFDLDAARAVVDGDDLDTGAVELAVLGLLDRALLVERTERPTPRYSMLDTVRRYGIERLEADGVLDATAERHARWILRRTEGAASNLAGPDEAVAATMIEDSVDELRAAHAWLLRHDLDGALQLAATLRPYALWRGHSELFRWAEASAAAAGTTDAPLLPEVLLAASTGAWQRGDLAGAQAAADVIRVLGVRARKHRAALEASADVALHTGDLERARADFTAAYQMALEDGDALQAVWNIGSAAVTAGYMGDTEAGLQLAATASDVADGCGSPSARAFAHFAIGELLAGEHPDAAEAHLWAAIELAAIADSRFVAGVAEVSLAALLSRREDFAAALAHCQSAIARWQRAGAWTPLWVTIRTAVALLVRAGALDDAAVLLAAAQTARTGSPAFGVDAAAMRRTAEQLRDALGSERIERATGAGRSMSDEEAPRFAIEALGRAAGMVPETATAPTSNRP